MATFTEIYYNGNEYKQMWLNGTKVWEKDSGGGEIVYPYPDVDSVITFRNTSISSKSVTFSIIDSTLPYSINGTSTNSFTFPANSETQLKFVNLKPCTKIYYIFPINIEQLRIPNLTDLSYLFYYFCNKDGYEYSWSPQYFEFNENPTSMKYMFHSCKYLTDEIMAKFMPHLSNFDTSQVTSMASMFSSCSSLTSLDVSKLDTSQVTTMANMFDSCLSLTELNLSSFNTSKVTDMSYFLYYCSSLTSLDLSSFDTSKVTNMNGMFFNCSSLTTLDLSNFDTSQVTDIDSAFASVSNCTIYIGSKWTLGTDSALGEGTNLTFINPIKSITLESTLTDVAIGTTFTVVPTVEPIAYDDELLVDYDTNYLSKDGDNYTVLEGASGQIVQIIYYSKHNNNVNAMLEFTVEEKAEPIVIDLQSTAPKLPDYLTLDYNSTYYFKNGSNGLYPSAAPSDEKSKLNYSRYKLIAPRNGVLKFTYRYYSNASYYFSINVNEDDTCPSYTSGNAVLENNRNYNKTLTSHGLEIIGGITYYIHLQLRTPSVYSDGSVQIKTITIE